MRDRARRVLQASAVEAYGRAGAYVTRDSVMHRANVADPEEFLAIEEYLYGKGWVADGNEDYSYFVVTPEGMAEATRSPSLALLSRQTKDADSARCPRRVLREETKAVIGHGEGAGMMCSCWPGFVAPFLGLFGEPPWSMRSKRAPGSLGV